MEIAKRYDELDSSLKATLEAFVGRYRQAGFQCLVVGGSIRDLLLGEVPKDFDFATNCPLEKSFQLFEKVLPTGVPQGTVTILFQNHSFEVTRFRKDVETDGRKAIVSFAESIEEDQIRRDLRINAIAFDPVTREVFDSQGGLADFAARRIRFVGKASERVLEDHLRALRYVRLIARLQPKGFDYDPNEMEEVLAAFWPDRLSLERVYEEFGKLFGLTQRNNDWVALHWCLLHPLRRLVSELERAKLMYTQCLALGGLLPVAFHALQAAQLPEPEWRLPKKTLQLARLLLRFAQQDLGQGVSFKALLSQAASFERAEVLAGVETLLGFPAQAQAQRILGQPLVLSELALSSQELMQLGLSGKALGEAQQRLLAHIWEHPTQNQNQILLALARTFVQ